MHSHSDSDCASQSQYKEVKFKSVYWKESSAYSIPSIYWRWKHDWPGLKALQLSIQTSMSYLCEFWFSSLVNTNSKKRKDWSQLIIEMRVCLKFVPILRVYKEHTSFIQLKVCVINWITFTIFFSILENFCPFHTTVYCCQQKKKFDNHWFTVCSFESPTTYEQVRGTGLYNIVQNKNKLIPILI
jgi:hypothetical protein